MEAVARVPARRLVAPALVGRAAELAALVSAVSATRAVVSVEGEAGVGKSRLVAELLRDPVLTGRRVLVGRCHPIRESFPLGPLIEAVRGVGAELGGLAPGPVAGALRGLLPELAQWLPPAPEQLDDRAAERHRVFRGLLEVLARLSPAVLVLEDVHWADEQTTDFLAYALSEPPGELVVLLTFRGEQVSPAVRELTARLPVPVTRAHVSLLPFDVAGTGALTGAILGVDRVSAEFAGYVWERTSGLPLAVEELLALVRLVPGRDGGWSRRELADLEVPAGIRDSTLARVAGLPVGARRLVEAAAVLQHPAPLAVLLEVTPGAAPGPVGQRGPARAAITVLEDAIASGLLVEHGDLVGFRHVLAAQAVYESLSSPRRQALHGRAAAALRTASPVPLGQVAHHVQNSGALADWAHAAEAAANQAIELGNHEEAVRLLGDVLRHAALDGEVHGRLAATLGRAAIETLHARDVAAVLSHALDRDLPRTLRGELQLLLAVTLNSRATDPARQRQLLREAVDALEDRPDLRAWAMVSLGIATTASVPLAEDLTWLHRSVDLAAELDDRLFEAFVLGKAGAVLVEVGDPEWRRLADRMLDITGGAPRLRRQVSAYYSLGASACYAGHLETAELLLTKALTAPASQESRRLEMMVRTGLALLSYSRGHWAGLGAELDVLLDELVGYPIVRFDAEIVAGGLALAHGKLDAADRHSRSALQVARDIEGHTLALVVAAGLAARAALARHDTEGGLARVRGILDVVDVEGGWVPLARTLPAMVEVLVTSGASGDAHRIVDRAAHELRDRDAPLAKASTAHAAGILAAAGGDPDGATGQLLGAADRYRRLLFPYEAAQAGEAAARCMLETHDERAASTLRDALTAYHRLGASWDAARVTRTARQHRITLRPRHGGGRRSYGAELSPREREVALLAAAGRSNQEIGRMLFLSASTVEKHMSAVLRKLGARSRAGVGERLAATLDPTAGGDPSGRSKNGGQPP